MKIRNHKLQGHDGRLVPFVPTPNGRVPLTGGTPRFLVLHYTAGGAASGSVQWFKRPTAGASAHLVIGRDGSITQMARFDESCWHAGKSRWKDVRGLNRHSVGIEMANWGRLAQSAAGTWLSWTGAPVSPDRVVMAEHKHMPGQSAGWEVFPPVQIEATIEAAQALVAEYGIAPLDLVGHDDISPLRKVDPGPAFGMDRFRARVFGRSDDDWSDVRFEVRAGSGLNLREEPSVRSRVLKTLADRTVVNVIENAGPWWLVAEVVNHDDDVTGYVHSHWLHPL
ncbi:MAG: N-acetylmuramoyl-L-alanine amidase [Myxococcota bacterium]